MLKFELDSITVPRLVSGYYFSNIRCLYAALYFCLMPIHVPSLMLTLKCIVVIEEVMAQDTSCDSSTPSDIARDKLGDSALNPAVVFTANRYRFNSNMDHRYACLMY